jgi:AcrR family transcriptional regulator
MDTKELIRNTLVRLLEDYSFDDLSVKMLCKEAGISKQTLYNHYYSILDALEDSYRIEFTRELGDCNTYDCWVEGFRRFLIFLRNKKRVILHLYFSSHRDEMMDMIRRNGEFLILKGIDDCSKDIEVAAADRDRTFMLNFYTNVLMGIIRDYLDGRMSEDPDYIAGRCDALMRHHIRKSLRNIHDLEKGIF